MTTIDSATEAERGSQRRWLVALAPIGIPLAAMFSLTMVLVATLSDRVLVTSRADLSSVSFGWPLGWVEQDQSSYEPPLPWHQGLLSPLENPTSVSLGAFLVDVLVVFALVSAVVLAATLMIAFVQRRLAIRKMR